jgi:hypothetical protein
LFVLLLLPLELTEILKEASPHSHRNGTPVRFCNARRSGGYRRQSLSEMQLGIRPPLTVQRDRSSSPTVPSSGYSFSYRLMSIRGS